MQQQHHMPHHMPQAPPPPPLVQRPGFPGMPMPGLANDFNRMHLEPNVHPFAHNMQQPAIQLIQPQGYGHMPDPRSFPSNGKPPASYVGYTFTKHPVEHVGQKETWAIVDRELMPGSQADLKDQVEKHRKKGVTGLDQYNNSDMKGFKRKQIDELIRECTKRELDHRFVYTIASIKRDTKRRQSGPETSAMQVILRRQTRPGVAVQGPFVGFGNIRVPMNALVDLSGAEDYERMSQNSSNGHRPGAYPIDRHMSEPWVHVTHADGRSPAQHAHSQEHAHPHNPGNAHGHGHGDFGSHDHAHGLEQPQHPHHGPHHPHEEAHDAKHGHEEKAKKKQKDQKPKSPKIIYVDKAEIHKSHDHSDLSSFSDSDSFSDDTDQTPDTIFSSEGSHYHHKDKKYHKSKHHRKSSSHDHEHEPDKVIYREHRRKEPMRRLSSPPPTRRSRYRYEDVIVEPDYAHHRRAEPRYPRERFDHHHRAMSYDDDHFHEHDMRGPARRPSVYRRRITMDPYEERRRHEIIDRQIREKEEEAFRRRERYRMMESDRLHVPHPHPRMERMHGYHDDHLHGYHDDHH